MSFLQDCVKQVRSRTENYTPPVDKIQKIRLENDLLVESTVLSPKEFVKYGGKRGTLFLKHIDDGTPFETVDDGTTTIKWIDDKDRTSFKSAIGQDKADAFADSLKARGKFKPTFVTSEGKKLTIKDLIKTAAYGGAGSSGEPLGHDWESIITHHYNILIGKEGADPEASAKVEAKWDDFDEMGQKLAQNFKDKIGSSAMQQYGAGKSSASLSDIWKTPAEGVSGGTDGTPKTDMFNGDYNISLKKAGGSQLASAAGGETIATFYAALSYLSKDKQGDKLITGLMSAIEKNFEKLSTSYSKSQLDKISKDPAKVKKFKDQDVIKKYITTEDFHKRLNKALDPELSKVTLDKTFKEWFIFEAMSGYKKFNAQNRQAVSSVCMEFNADNGNVSQYYKISKNGKSSGLASIKSVSPDVKAVAKKAKIYAAWKSSGGNPYSSLRISNSNDPFDHGYDDTTLMGCIRKTIHEDKISHKFLTEETYQLDEFAFVTKAFGRLKSMGKNAVMWLKNLMAKILKAIKGALKKIKQLGEKMFEGLFKFIGVKPEVKSTISKDVHGFIYGMAN